MVILEAIARLVPRFSKPALLLCLLLISRTAAGQVTVTDVSGATVTLDEVPQRIVSLMPSNTELLFEVGAGGAVVGVTNYCDFPPEAREIEKIGGAVIMSLEKIVALGPDLVLASEANSQELVYSLRALDIPVYVVEPRSIEDILDAIAKLGILTGREEAVQALLAGYRQRLAAVAARLGNLPESERPTVFVGSPFRDENWTPGPETFASAAIHRAGGRNVADDLAPGTWSVYNLENIVSRNPQVLLSTLREGQDPEQAVIRFLDRAKALTGWRDLDAVRNGRVVLIPEDWLVRPTPRLFLAIEALAAALHPTLF